MTRFWSLSLSLSLSLQIAIEDVPTEIKDSDDILESEFFDTRQAFLSLCQGNHYQYDTLRRAKHSSMMILYHLHNPTVPAFATACAICQQELEPAQGWRCEACPDYEVCSVCYSKGINHPHSLISRPAATDSVVPNTKTNQTALVSLLLFQTSLGFLFCLFVNTSFACRCCS